MSLFKSISQAGQDAFVHALIPKPGTFLDIGSGHPITISNTYALEQIGWRGLCVDQGDVVDLYAKHRKSKFVQADATKLDYVQALNQAGLPLSLDYLSLDVDHATLPVALWFPWDKIRFRVLTVEHDRYRCGDELAEQLRRILTGAGYVIAAKDICSEGLPYEDWWVEPALL